MVIEPVIKSYVPLDDEDRIEEKTAEKKEKEEFSLEDEHAFTMGLITIIIIVGMALIFGIWYLRARLGQKGEIKKQEASESQPQSVELLDESQVLGEQVTQPELNLSVDLQSEEEIIAGESYTIEAGDTLYSIGVELKVNWEDIAELNNLERPYNLKPGEKLKIPERGN